MRDATENAGRIFDRWVQPISCNGPPILLTLLLGEVVCWGFTIYQALRTCAGAPSTPRFLPSNALRPVAGTLVGPRRGRLA